MKKLSLFLFFLFVVSCSSEENSTDEVASSPVFLDSNGVTVKAKPDATIGDSGIINGIVYKIVSGTELRDMIANGTDVSSVCTSRITNMDNLFYGKTNFDGKIGSWDVSNVVSMEKMFAGAESFDRDISNWDVSEVKNMANMFSSAIDFNQNINDWDVSNVSKVIGMFHSAWSFNKPLDKWNLSKVEDMQMMFWYASEFNQDISTWDVSNVTDMEKMFEAARKFNQDLSGWDTSSVYDAKTFCCNAQSWSKPKPKFTKGQLGASSSGANDYNEIADDPCTYC